MTDRLIEAQAVNEMMRLNMLESFQKPDADLSSSMQSITRLAMKLLDVPSAMVVLVGKEDLIPLSRTGVPVPDVPRQDSFCTEAIKGDGLLVVANAVEDDRFSKTELVKAGIRFYAGAPVTVDGHLNVGTLCVFDTRPRDLSETDVSGMEDLAELASEVLEAHRARRHSRSPKRASAKSRVLGASLEEKNLYLELSERTAGVGHWRVDLATREVNWSDEMYRIHMLNKEEHQPDLESGIGLFHPNDQDDVRMAVDAAFAESKPFHFQKRLIRRDGDTRHVRCRGEIQGAEFGSGGILFGILQDVTESVRAQQQLQLSEQRLATAVESTGAGLWDWNVGTETLYWSPRYREIIGLVDDDFIPTNSYFNSLLHPDDRREVVATLVAHVQKHEQFSELFRMAHQDGHYVWVKCSGRPIWDEQGQPLRIVGAIDDISEQMELEQDLRQRCF